LLLAPDPAEEGREDDGQVVDVDPLHVGRSRHESAAGPGVVIRKVVDGTDPVREHAKRPDQG
jgi:hypothetical protein